MAEVKRAGKDWHKIRPGDLIVCAKTRDVLMYSPDMIGRTGICVRRGEKTSKRVESDLALIDGQVVMIDLVNWERVS